MAKHVLYNASLVVNSVDLSDHDNQIEYVVGIDGQPAAAMGELQSYGMPGTQTVSPIKVKLFQDYAAGKTYATLIALYSNRTTFNVAMKADAGATATTNPLHTVPCFIGSLPVISGTRGDAHMIDVTFEPAGLLAITTS